MSENHSSTPLLYPAVPTTATLFNTSCLSLFCGTFFRLRLPALSYTVPRSSKPIFHLFDPPSRYPRHDISQTIDGVDNSPRSYTNQDHFGVSTLKVSQQVCNTTSTTNAEEASTAVIPHHAVSFLLFHHITTICSSSFADPNGTSGRVACRKKNDNFTKGKLHRKAPAATGKRIAAALLWTESLHLLPHRTSMDHTQVAKQRDVSWCSI